MEENINEKTIEIMPMVALRGLIIFPNSEISFDAGRKKSINAITLSAEKEQNIFLVSQKNVAIEDPDQNQIYKVGTVCKIRQIIKTPGDNLRILVQGLYKAEIVSYTKTDDYFEVGIQKFTNDIESENEIEACLRVAEKYFIDFRKSGNVQPLDKGATFILVHNNADEFVDNITAGLNCKLMEKQKIMEDRSLISKLNKISKLLLSETEITQLEKKIGNRVKKQIDKNQKEFYLREQIKAIHSELGEDDNEKNALIKKINDKKMPEEVTTKALSEVNKLDKLSPQSPEVGLIKTYLDWVLDIPWSEHTEDRQSLIDATKILNEDHYGLDKVKERIIEYLAVINLTHSLKGPILCFVGPPGVGKTSIAKSVARALNRNFVRMSLGGIRDEAEIRGHRRTYVGAMPGRIIYNLKIAKSNNSVFLLDEVDKLTSDLRGDPASALLEVLDPEQNNTFRDNFLEVPYDLSKTMFICTSNSLEQIPAPLLDRMEVIEINGYSEEEKIEIAKRYLIPKKLLEHGLELCDLDITLDGLKAIINGYTIESGVRNLEREIANICRKVATKKASNLLCGQIIIDENNVQEYLGVVKFLKDKKDVEDEVGAVTGLAWTQVGGTTLTIEVTIMKGKGEILLTGKLGDVMKESARTAISVIRSRAEKYGIDPDRFANTDIHIHVPEGSTPKDGPSAGITMAIAILSAFTNRKVDKNVAMTGEITLRGRVLPIGGLKEKSLAGHRLGISRIIIPYDNLKDLEEIPKNVRDEIEFIPAKDIDTVIKYSLK